ncbi:MAG: hypothetical protein ACRBEE_15080 [Arenicella sp.]
MLTGIQALNNIDNSLQTVKNEIHRIDNELTQLTSQLAANRQQQARTTLHIAKVRLTSISDGSLLDRLSVADKEALLILEQRQHALKDLDNLIQTHRDAQEALEVERQTLLTEANILGEELANKEASIQSALEKNAEYMNALARAREADNIADEAERKAHDSTESLEEKGKPYLADDLFMYLWNRKYGTTEYKNYNPITRFLDGWVARKAKYQNARANYWNIQEIPKRLRQHAAMVREKADTVIHEIQALEEASLESGGAKTVQAELEQVRNNIDQCDEKITTSEKHMNDLLFKHGQFASADDPQMQQCLNILKTAIEHQSINGLRQIVVATRSPDDDFLLDDLNRYQTQYQDIKDDIDSLRSAHNAKLNRLKELEDVRRNFKRHRYDDMRSGFGNDAMIGAILGQFLEGLVSGSEVWRVLQRNQRHRDVGAWPDFGSGGLGQGGGLGGLGGLGKPRRRNTSVLNDIFGSPRRQSRRNSSWHWPDSNNGGFRLPSGRASSNRGSNNGGFRTGGGF